MASKTRRRFTAEDKTEAVARLSTPGAHVGKSGEGAGDFGGAAEELVA